MLETLFVLVKYSTLTSAIVAALYMIFRILYIFDDVGSHKLKPIDFISAAILIIVSSLRYGVGSDYYKYHQHALEYYRFFHSLSKVFAWENMKGYDFQIGYPALSVLTYNIFENHPYAIFFTVACVLYIPYFMYFRKRTANVFIAIAVYMLFGFWGLSLNIIKQAVSMVFILYAYEYFREKKYLRFTIACIFAVFFHTTGFLAIAGIIAAKFVKPTIRNFTALVVSGLAMKVLFMVFIRILVKFSFFSKYYNRYFVDGSVANTDRTLLLFGAFFETVMVIWLIYYAIKHKKQLETSQSDIGDYLSIMMIGIPFSILGVSRTLWLANRFAKFFFQFILVLIPAIYGKKEQSFLKWRVKLNKWAFSFDTRAWGLVILFVWHFMYSVLMLDNNTLEIKTLFSL